MWVNPYYAGGIMDARFGETGFQTTHYQGLTFEPIIINGIVYYNARDNAHGSTGVYAVDLYTGETLFYLNQTVQFGQIYNYDSPNQHGGFAYLWRTSGVTIDNPGGVSGTVWEMIDATTGNSICKIANVSASGTAVYGKDGSILRYSLFNHGTQQTPNYYLRVWNTSAIPSMLLGDTGTNYWQWRPGMGGRGQRLGGEYIHDGNKAWSLNVSIPVTKTGSVSIYAVREDESIIIGNPGLVNEQGTTQGWLMALSLEQGQEGTKLWERSFTPPSSAGNKTITLAHVDPEDGVFIFSDIRARTWYGYDLNTGKLIWTSDPEPAYHSFSMGSRIYEGMLISHGDGMAAGTLFAYDVKTGELLWTYEPKQIGTESPYGNYPISITAIADGKIYTISGEHSPTQPLWRGSYLRCINASNGVELWKILHWGAVQSAGLNQGMVVPADGLLVGLNLYDNQIYCYGKGPSKTTVDAPSTAIQLGQSLVISGTVLDIAPGATDSDRSARFPNGVPAVSDESQNAWMEYVYMQQAKPTNATGVTVELFVLDSNGNYRSIGTTTTDTNGFYSYQWTPDISGKYNVYAVFRGTESYYGSQDTAAFAVDEPASTPTPLPTAIPSMADQYFLPAIAALFVAVIICIAMVALVLKKKP
jgi:hypothetical protein